MFRKGSLCYLCPKNPFEIIFRKGYLCYFYPKNLTKGSRIDSSNDPFI